MKWQGVGLASLTRGKVAHGLLSSNTSRSSRSRGTSQIGGWSSVGRRRDRHRRAVTAACVITTATAAGFDT
jgi:hypothetical protein